MKLPDLFDLLYIHPLVLACFSPQLAKSITVGLRGGKNIMAEGPSWRKGMEGAGEGLCRMAFSSCFCFIVLEAYWIILTHLRQVSSLNLLSHVPIMFGNTLIDSYFPIQSSWILKINHKNTQKTLPLGDVALSVLISRPWKTLKTRGVLLKFVNPLRTALQGLELESGKDDRSSRWTEAWEYLNRLKSH